MDDSIKGSLADKIAPAALKAIEEDGAEVITLGCAALSGLDTELSQRIGVPVIDGIPYAIRLAETHVKTHSKTSKKGLFGPSTWR
jgi:allantoin racemase